MNEDKSDATNTILLNDVWVNTFNIVKSNVAGGIQVEDSNGFGLRLDDEASVAGNITVNGAGVANFSGDFKNKKIFINQASEVRMEGAKFDNKSEIRVASSGAKIFADGAAGNGAKIIAAAKDVMLYTPDGTPNGFELKYESGCNFVQIDSKGDKTSGNAFADTEVVKPAPVLEILRTVEILPEGLGEKAGKDGNMVITTGAITGSGLDLKQVKKNIVEASVWVTADGEEVKGQITVDYILNSTNQVTLSNDVLKLKDNPTTNASDELIVRLTYKDGDYTERLSRTITIRKN